MGPKRVALITTTINVPEMLTLYANDWSINDELDGALDIIVAGDVQTPPETKDLVEGLGGTYIPVDSMLAKRWRTDKHVGHRSIQRRNIALLHAIASGAELIITVDDDNTPSGSYFSRMLEEFNRDTTRVFSAKSGWFNPGTLLYPRTVARGYPIAERHVQEMSGVYSWMNEPIGVVNGLTTGDPDIDAIERIVNWPKAHRITLNENIAMAFGTWAPFNTQNTAFVRELAPLMQCLVGVGRYDDIFMSYIARVIMDATGWRVSYGEPTTYSKRNEHDILVDLERELYGYKTQASLIEALRAIEADKRIAGEDGIVEMLCGVYELIASILPSETDAANVAWIQDVETAMKEGA